MAKRRTRKDKEHAKHYSGVIHWEPKSSVSEATVKRQIDKSRKTSLSGTLSKVKSESSAQLELLALTKRDIVKSLVLALVIIGAEVVLYFIWKI